MTSVPRAHSTAAGPHLSPTPRPEWLLLCRRVASGGTTPFAGCLCFLLGLCLAGLLSAGVASAQTDPVIEMTVTVSTDEAHSKTLALGLAPTATEGIDPALGEAEQPPPPPSDAFDARWIDDDIAATGLGEGLVRDVRPGAASFRGTKVHELRYQPGQDVEEVTIAWALPQGATAEMTDLLTSGDLVQVSMAGDGSFHLANLDVTKLLLTVAYDPPEASDDEYEMLENQTLEITDPDAGVLANDTGPGSSDLVAELETDVSNGNLALDTDGTFSYTPNDSFSGEDAFSYVAVQGPSPSVPASVTISVLPVNDPPTITEIADVEIPEDASTGALAVTVGDKETDPADLTLTTTSDNPALVPKENITVGESEANRVIEVAPRPDSNGTATVTVTVSDGSEQASTAFVLTVTPVNDPPAGTGSIPDFTLRLDDPPLEVTEVQRSIFSDPDGDSLSLSAASSDPTVVSAAVEEGTVLLTPSGVGTASVTVTASDGQSETSVRPFAATVSDPDSQASEPASEHASAVVSGSDRTDVTVDLGATGTTATLRQVQGPGLLQMRFFQGEDNDARRGVHDKTVPTHPFDAISPYRWEAESDVTFESVDVRFQLANDAVVGITDPETVTVVHDATGDGQFSAVSTAFDDGDTPADPGDDVLVIHDLDHLGTFRFASNTNPLPVELTHFSAHVDGDVAVLEWTTLSETNNAGFEVQHRPPDAPTYIDNGFVSGARTTSEAQSYRFRVESLQPGPHHFRLQQVDTDGRSTPTAPVAVTLRAQGSLTLTAPHPNPTRHSARLSFTVQQEGRATVTMYDVLGQQVRVLYDDQASVGARETVRVRTDTLPSGTYFVRLQTATGTRTQRIAVVR